MNDLNSLTECLVDWDVETRMQAGSLRRKAFAISIVIEAFLLAMLLVWPLLMPGSLHGSYRVMPLPPFPGLTRPAAFQQHPSEPHSQIRRSGYLLTLTQGPVRPQIHSGPAASSIEPLDLPGTADGGVYGTGIPGATGDHPLNIQPPHTVHPPARPIFVSSGVMEAMLIHRVQPEYPSPARMMRLTGTVELRAVIGTDGQVREIVVLSGNPILARAAVDAVREWRYQPTKLDNQSVEVETFITVKFVSE